jgi:hypothetical protein
VDAGDLAPGVLFDHRFALDAGAVAKDRDNVFVHASQLPGGRAGETIIRPYR